jgi:hypothetical protein
MIMGCFPSADFSGLQPMIMVRLVDLAVRVSARSLLRSQRPSAGVVR